MIIHGLIMPGNSIAISRELVSAGVEKKTADAVAEAIVTVFLSFGDILENSLKDLEFRVGTVWRFRRSIGRRQGAFQRKGKAFRAEYKGGKNKGAV